MSGYLTAKEAASTLGISLQTLYAYVSRGMLHSSIEPGSRRRRYPADDVRRLARRKADGKRAGKVAQKVLDWGVPVLESRITLIHEQRLYYRGRDAMALARTATLEEAAALLWACESARLQTAPALTIGEAQWHAWFKETRGYAPHERALMLLPAAAARLPRIWAQDRAAQLDTGTMLLHVLAAVLALRPPSRDPLHRQLAAAWGVSGRSHVDLLRAALVACADHELNASAFTVRCIASTGMHLFGAVTGGLAALAGPRHCGETMRVTTLFEEAARERDIDRYLATRIAHDDGSGRTILPGFGHPLYPDGDPRGALLLELLRACVLAPRRPPAHLRAAMRDVDLVVAAALRATGLAPTVDFALSAIERVLALPAGASFALFALGRATGWIAHAMEQLDDGRLIRPRARYVGEFNPQD